MFILMVGVAQLVRASDCGSEGREFESPHPPQNFLLNQTSKIAPSSRLPIFLRQRPICATET